MLGSEAAILPRIVAIGDVDEDEIAFDEAGRDDFGAALDVPEALGGLERRLLLARLVMTWAKNLAPQQKGRSAADLQQSRCGAGAGRRSCPADG